MPSLNKAITLIHEDTKLGERSIRKTLARCKSAIHLWAACHALNSTLPEGEVLFPYRLIRRDLMETSLPIMLSASDWWFDFATQIPRQYGQESFSKDELWHNPPSQITDDLRSAVNAEMANLSFSNPEKFISTFQENHLLSFFYSRDSRKKEL